MAVLKVKRLVAVCFLEAAKTTLEHLGAFRLQLSEEGTAGPPDLTRTYGEVRRLRDYLQRCGNVRQDEVELDMADADQRLLVACCRRSVEVIDHTLAGRAPLAAEEILSIRKKRQVLADWAVELALYPLLDLPLHQLAPFQLEASRALLGRMQEKVRGEALEKAKVVESQEMARVNLALEPVAASPDESVEPTPIAVEAPRRPPAASTCLLDTSKLRDARLRTMVETHLASYECCMAAGDYRLAEVLLGSVVEAALLDHVLPRRTELGLKSTPETWSPQGLLIQVMGEQLSSADHAMVNRLISARSLLRPAMQLIAPMIVTFEKFETLREFVQWVLARLGYAMD